MVKKMSKSEKVKRSKLKNQIKKLFSNKAKLSALVDQVVDDLIKDSHSVINIKNK
jgi:hypothetical protein